MTEPGSRRDWWLLLPALPLVAIGLGDAFGEAHGQPPEASPEALTYVLVVMAALPLLLRRRDPVLGLAIGGVAMIVYFALGYPFGPILLVGPFAVYAVVEKVELRRALTASIVFLVAIGLSVAPRFVERGDWLDLALWFVAWSAIVAAPAAIGAAVRTRRQAADEVRAEQARRAVSEERLRVAQEVHDVVGHGLAVIAMQAGVALHVLDRSPDRARESLLAILATSREALGGLRAELDQLRAPTEAARTPSQGVADVPALVERMRAAGADVTLSGEDLDPLPPEVDRAAYRIVQESLTNVLRHAAGASTTVIIERSEDALIMTIADSGPRSGQPAAVVSDPDGTGIEGMRQRAATLGGTVVAEREGAGFAVRARLPIGHEEPGP